MNYDVISTIYDYLYYYEWWRLAFTSKEYYDLWLKHTKEYKFIVSKNACSVLIDPEEDIKFHSDTKIIGIYDKYSKAYKKMSKVTHDKYHYGINMPDKQQGILFRWTLKYHEEDYPVIINHDTIIIHYGCFKK